MSNEIPQTEEESPPRTIDVAKIEKIYDYTKFHIGMYSTLLTLLIGIHTYSRGKEIGELYGSVILWVIVMLLVGGIAGAFAASRIVYGKWENEHLVVHDNWFWRWNPLRPKSKYECLRWYSWSGVFLTLEHYAFWFALFYALLALTWFAGDPTIVPKA